MSINVRKFITPLVVTAFCELIQLGSPTPSITTVMIQPAQAGFLSGTCYSGIGDKYQIPLGSFARREYPLSQVVCTLKRGPNTGFYPYKYG